MAAKANGGATPAAFMIAPSPMPLQIEKTDAEVYR